MKQIVVSIQAKAWSAVLRLLNLKSALGKELDRDGKGVAMSAEPPKRMYADFDIAIRQSSGRIVYTVKPKSEPSAGHIFYLHGGAYVFGFSTLHWSFIARLVRATSCTVVAPDYPLAPNNTYIDSFQMVEPVYRELVASVGSENVFLMGDSAGGGFALALAQKMKAEGVEPAKGIILLSPWLDISLENSEITELQSIDPILDASALRRAGRSYAGNASLSNYLVSPINGALEGIGVLCIFIGTHDILLADARKLMRTAEQQGLRINYFEYEGLFHCWMLFNLPESDRVVQQIADLTTQGKHKTLKPF